MKKIIFSLLFIFGLTSAYSQSSWTNTDRKAFVEACVPAAQEGMSKKKAKKYCDCALYKVEQMYPDPTTAGNIAPDEINKVAEMCLKIIEGKEAEEEMIPIAIGIEY